MFRSLRLPPCVGATTVLNNPLAEAESAANFQLEGGFGRSLARGPSRPLPGLEWNLESANAGDPNC
eukprot:1726400-Alexandrium_andersonii.AAC.1